MGASDLKSRKQGTKANILGHQRLWKVAQLALFGQSGNRVWIWRWICCYLQLIDLLVIAYALVLLFHPEYAVVPRHYPDLYRSNKHNFDVIPLSTVDRDHETTDPAMNLTAGFAGNVTSSLRSACWTNCGVLAAPISLFPPSWRAQGY